MYQFILFLRSVLFFLFSTISIVIMGFVCLFLLLFPVKFRHKVIRKFLKLYLNTLTFICGIRYEVEGLENIPKDRVGVILCKHQSAWETFFLPIVFHDPAAIAKRELLWVPFFGWGMLAGDHILINRSDKMSAMQQIIRKGKACLADHRWIMVFPEGTRVPVGHVGKYHLGGTRLAVAAEAPVIPVAHNAGYFWARRKFIKKPGTIKVVIGPLIETKGRTPDEVMQLSKEWIESTVTRIGGLVKEPTRQ